MTSTQENAPAASNSRGVGVHGKANAQILLDRLDDVQKSGAGWRARCPACKGASRKVVVREDGDRVLLHCFGGCKPFEVLQVVGLTWAAVQPPRSWPDSPEDRRRAQRALREIGWASALSVLAIEGAVVESAISTLAAAKPLHDRDIDRLRLANERIGKAANILIDADKRGLAVIR